jgi:hypothetical protein
MVAILLCLARDGLFISTEGKGVAVRELCGLFGNQRPKAQDPSAGPRQAMGYLNFSGMEIWLSVSSTIGALEEYEREQCDAVP